MEKKCKIIFLVGPTAVGKSAVAVHVAKKNNAEIVSCDSMQVYKGMDVLTSKPPLDLRKIIPHHLISIISPTQEYNVFTYRRDALKKIREIIKKGKVPLFVGGTGLYMSILIDGIFKAKADTAGIRARLYKAAETRGKGYLYGCLKRIDPLAAARIHPHDIKRIIRALEVFKATGKRITQLQRKRRGLSMDFDIRIYCLTMERSRLYGRIERRVDEMFERGLEQEVKKLLRLKLSKTAGYAIGIRELKGHYEGAYDLEAAKELIKRNTRRYAKRQLSWFRKDKRIVWLEVGNRETAAQVAKRVLCKLSRTGPCSDV